MRGIRVDELREEGEEEERDLRIERVDDERPGRRRAGGAPPRDSPGIGLGVPTGEKRPEPEADQIRGARVLDDRESQGRGREQRRQPDSGRSDMDERADLDPENRRDALRADPGGCSA